MRHAAGRSGAGVAVHDSRVGTPARGTRHVSHDTCHTRHPLGHVVRDAVGGAGAGVAVHHADGGGGEGRQQVGKVGVEVGDGLGENGTGEAHRGSLVEDMAPVIATEPWNGGV